MAYTPDEQRYEKMKYRRLGNSGLLIPAISLGLWHNFGDVDRFDNMREMIRRAFDLGITHFDLANNYGPKPGSAETNFGRILKQDFQGYRDEMIISTKAGYTMWPGPYGDHGSKKYLVSSLDQSLKRMDLDYVDIFYHHRPDPDTVLEETMQTLDLIVRQGKALYVGLSNYNAEDTRKAATILKEQKTPFVIHQPRYNMFDRWVEDGLLDVLEEANAGSIAFVPLGQGLLTSKYLKGIPEESRAKKPSGFLKEKDITDEKIMRVDRLNQLAGERGQSLAQMAIAWVLRDRITSALIGASKVEQIEENVKALDNLEFSAEELKRIDDILA
jgi:L-glyceraldehyde 3-phosphate reductase